MNIKISHEEFEKAKDFWNDKSIIVPKINGNKKELINIIETLKVT